jgi:hypothetical protein
MQLSGIVALALTRTVAVDQVVSTGRLRLAMLH